MSSVIAFKQAPTCLHYNKFDFQSIYPIKSITINPKLKILLASNSTKSYLSNEHPHVYIKATLIFNQFIQLSQLSKIWNFRFYQHRILQSPTFPTNHRLLKTYLKWLRYISDSQTNTLTYFRNSRVLSGAAGASRYCFPALPGASRRFPALPGASRRAARQLAKIHMRGFIYFHMRSFIWRASYTVKKIGASLFPNFYQFFV